MAGCTNGTRGVWGGGGSPTHNVMQYITIDSLGDSTDFGDLQSSKYGVGCSSGT